MIHITDEMLMAYVDGEVSAAEAAVVKEAIGRDAELQVRVQRLTALQTRLRDAFDADELGEPNPQLSALVAPANPAPASVTRIWPRANRWVVGSALAACLAVVAALPLLRNDVAPWVAPVADGVALAGEVNAIAMTGVSGADYRLDGMTVSPVLSFVAKDKRVCRELALASPELNARLIVCRSGGDDDWCFEAFSRTHPAGNAAHPYAAAGREPDATIEAAYGRLQVVRELSVEDERAAIASKWTGVAAR